MTREELEPKIEGVIGYIPPKNILGVLKPRFEFNPDGGSYYLTAIVKNADPLESQYVLEDEVKTAYNLIKAWIKLGER